MLTDTPTLTSSPASAAAATVGTKATGAAKAISATAVTTSTSSIPGEKERPSFVVFDDWHEEGAAKLRPGFWHFGTKAGRGEAPPALTQQWVCSPLHLNAVTTDAQGNNYGRLLRIKSTLGRWTTWAMPMAMLRGDCSDLRGELLGMGVEIDPFNRTMLGVYLQDRAPTRRVQCALQTGWASKDFKAFVLPDSAIGPQATSVIYPRPRGARPRNTPWQARWPDGRQAPPRWRWATRCWCWP